MALPCRRHAPAQDDTLADANAARDVAERHTYYEERDGDVETMRKYFNDDPKKLAAERETYWRSLTNEDEER